MRVGICAEWIGTRAGGIETYAAELVASLARIDPLNDYTLYTTHPDALCELAEAHDNLRAHYLGTRSRWLALPAAIPWQLLRRPVDVVHATMMPPPLCPAPLVFTVHDLIYLQHPKWYPAPIRARLALLTRLGVRKASRIIAVSEDTRRSLLETYRIPEERVRVVYEGVDRRFRPPADPEASARRLTTLGIEGPFVLYVGRFHARKNLVRLVQAFARIREQVEPKLALVLVGRDQYHGAEVSAEIERLRLGDRVVCPGHVDGALLPDLYGAARLVACPSLYEGFGLPLLEAMACGAPVLTSDRGALPEVVGDAARVVDPLCVDGLARALAELLADADARRELSRRGLARAARFDWEDTARRTLEVYAEAAGEGAARLGVPGAEGAER